MLAAVACQFVQEPPLSYNEAIQPGYSFTAETLRTQSFMFSQRTKRLLCGQNECLSVLCVSAVSGYEKAM